MSESESNVFSGRKLFTVEQANAALPLVRAIAKDVAELSQSISERRERLSSLQGPRGGPGKSRSDMYSAELAQVETEIEADIQQLKQYVGELQQLGVELKSALDGLVDFPAEMEGRPVYLCWKLGEPEVMHWHAVDAGFAGRQSLGASIAMDDTAGDSTSA